MVLFITLKKKHVFMVKENVKIIDPVGLHARPAGELAGVSNRFNSDVSLVFNGQTANAKSIIGLMSLGIANGSDITIVCNGTDEAVAMTEIKKFMSESKLI